MRLTVVGKVVVLILVAGGAAGAWRMANNGPASNGGPGAGRKGVGSASGGTEIPFIITAAKKDWVQDQVDAFNAAHQGRWWISTKPVPSREAMHAILAGKEKPVLWSPGSPIWPSRLAEAWHQKNGGTVLDMADPNGYRVFLRSPLVFLTTRKKADYLRTVLAGPNAWENLRKLSTGKQRAPWGYLRFSHADPLTSSSGMLTLGLVLADYGQRTGRGGRLDRLATNPEFVSYVQSLERGLIYDTPAEKGTTALTKAFVEDPSRYDFITAYESAALEAVEDKPELAVIYPTPTAVSEHAVSLLSGEWVTREQREGALAFMTFLGGKDALESGIKYNFRPAQASGSVSLAPVLSHYSEQGFQQTFTSTELPPYEALNAAAYQWRVKVAHKPPTAAEKQ